MSPEIAQRRIQAFEKRFKSAHLFLAYHAAFPLALTPDLLYRLWVNFQQDVHGEVLSIPWVAVANLLLSSLCDEVGYELYEMKGEVRSKLLELLEKNSRFGKERIKQLSDFLIAYVTPKLQSRDEYVRDFAYTQKWTALAFVEPNEAARQLALALHQAYNKEKQDKYELVRVASLIETLAVPLKDYQPLLFYSRGMVNFACNNTKDAIDEFNKLPQRRNRLEVEEVSLDIPQPQKLDKKLRLGNLMLQQLYFFQEYGESVIKGLESVKDEIPGYLSKCIENLREAANKTIESATSQVKIAIMGEIGSGKTLLVGSLIGYADALPVNEPPTTGNVTAIHLVQPVNETVTTGHVTAIHFVQQEEFQTTKVEQFQVEYLTDQGVKECLEFMLTEAEKRATAAALPQAQIDFIKNFRQTNPEDWNAILKWCEQAWNNSTNVELRYLLRELVVFARTYSAYGDNLCDKTYIIDDPTTAKEGLRLALPENILHAFDHLPSEPEPWEDFTEPSVNDLQNSLSLIRRIDVTVKVSTQIWDLSSLRGTNEFVLLDLPGLGSENSGVRDMFLSLKEIEGVQTFLLLLNGRSSAPGQTEAKIRTMIQQYKGEDLTDRIIVGVGRFNQLPLNATNQQAIDDLIDRPLVPKEEDVLQELDILRQTIISAGNLTNKKDKILLLSQTFGLAKLALESRLVEVCSPQFRPELDHVNKSDSDESLLRGKWKQLSEMLLEDQPHSTLGRQLGDFAEDGGIGRLRSLLQTHVAEHGLKQLCDDTRRAAQELRQQQDNLKTILKIQENPIVESTAYADLHQAINILKTTYRDFVEDLRKQPLLKYNRVAVRDVVKEELSFKISNWSEWTALFNRIEDGIIKPYSTAGGTTNQLYRERDKHKNSIPTKSDDFYDTFVKSYKELKDFANKCTQEAVKQLLSELSTKVKPQRNTIREILRPEMEQQIKDKFGADSEAADLFYNLLVAEEPNEWSGTIIAKIDPSNSTDDNAQTINFQTLFPLAHADDKHEFGQFFDWSSSSEKKLSKPFNHQFLVLRLRSEIIASVSLNLVRYVSQLTKIINSQLFAILDATISILLDASKNEVLLREMAAGEQSIPHRSLLLETLSQISLISSPQL